jgi:hypothetical protein
MMRHRYLSHEGGAFTPQALRLRACCDATASMSTERRGYSQWSNRRSSNQIGAERSFPLISKLLARGCT